MDRANEFVVACKENFPADTALEIREMAGYS
jgi:hypothetical protein